MKSFKTLREELRPSSTVETLDESFTAGIEDAPTARELGIKSQFGFAHHPSVQAKLDDDTAEDGEIEDRLFDKKPPKKYVKLDDD